MKQQRSQPHRRCRGAFAVMTAPALVVMVLATGLALDSALLYNRKVELSGLARAAALAAARKLDGTREGIAAARAAAAVAAERYRYRYGAAVDWNDAALSFSTGPSRGGAWLGAGSIADAAGYHYAKVDTGELGAELGAVQTGFIQMFSQRLHTTMVSDSAIAGRDGIRAVPLAVCAMSAQPAGARAAPDLDAELVEFGFRRGVSYDLMQLNPKGITPARWVINPVIPPGGSGGILNPAILGPFVCSGTMWMPRLQGGTVRVSTLDGAAPLSGLVDQLNSRFGDYGAGPCHASGAPPDTNVFKYRYELKEAPWMSPLEGLRGARKTTERGRLETVADIPPPGSTLSGLNAGSFGPLWSFAKAVKYASWSALGEGRSDYDTFAPADWPKLYRDGLSSPNYPNKGGTPYLPIGSTNPPIAAPVDNQHFATPYRRVLYLPLLDCENGLPTGANTPATIAGVGKFFMTAPAASDSLVAEFAGAAPPQTIPATVELYP